MQIYQIGVKVLDVNYLIEIVIINNISVKINKLEHVHITDNIPGNVELIQLLTIVKLLYILTAVFYSILMILIYNKKKIIMHKKRVLKLDVLKIIFLNKEIQLISIIMVAIKHNVYKINFLLLLKT